MKPQELLKDFDRVTSHSHVEKTLNRYLNEDVVTSYIKNSFGVVFLIKGKIKPFAFSILKREITNYYYGYNMTMITLKNFFILRDIAEQESQNVIMVDDEKEKKIKALCLLEELKKE